MATTNDQAAENRSFKKIFGAINVVTALIGLAAAVAPAADGNYQKAVERLIITLALVAVIYIFSYSIRNTSMNANLAKIIAVAFVFGILAIFFNLIREYLTSPQIPASLTRLDCQEQKPKFPKGNGIEVKILQPQTVYYCRFKLSIGTQYNNVSDIKSVKFSYNLLSSESGLTSTSTANIVDFWYQDGSINPASDTAVDAKITDNTILFGVFIKLNNSSSKKYEQMFTMLQINPDTFLDTQVNLSDTGIPIGGS